ncbi:leukemia inhibitory factor receptor-like [Polymixia lowei]
MFSWLLLVSLFCGGTQHVNGEDDGVIQCEPQNVAVNYTVPNRMLLLTWENDPFCSRIQEALTYEVEVLLTDSMKQVHHDDVIVRPDQARSTHSWNWTSPVALECDSYSVKLSSRYKNITSQWNQTIPGIPPSNEPQVFPKDQVVEVGSNITFCCILGSGGWFDQMMLQGYNKNEMITTKISNEIYAVTVHLHSPSPFSGTDVTCNTNDYGTCVYVGYPPADKDLVCETRDLESVECHWRVGRDTHLTAKRKTDYLLLGRPCLNDSVCNRKTKECRCHQRVQVNSGERNWILKAQNQLGMLELTDKADLTKRVHMYAPEKLTVSSVNARNASLEWEWTTQPYIKLPIVCQIELSHGGQTDIRNDSGVGLHSMVLRDLTPHQTYKVQVQCGTKQHFWKWSNWSRSTFQTKGDVPDALDIWMLMENNQTVIIWKTPLANQSHGQIIHYEVSWGKTTETGRQQTIIFPPNNSVALSLDTSEEHNVTVDARNLNGSSSPSAITVPRLYPERVMNPSKIIGSNGGFNLSWSDKSSASCGYVVDWCATVGKCVIEWLKVPPGVTNATIVSENIRDGVRYLLSVYACTQGTPVLLDRREGYVREKKLPDNLIQGLTWEQLGLDVQVSWTAIAPRDQSAFIRGYIMYYTVSDTNSSISNVSTDNPEANSLTARNLESSSYIFTVKALTSVGEGGDNSFSLTMNSLSDKMIMAVTISLVHVLILLSLVTVLCYKNWTCIKQKVYPPIPKPVLTDDWLTLLGNRGHQILHVDPCHHNGIDSVDVPELYCELAPVNGDIKQEEGPFVSKQSHSPQGYCILPRGQCIPAPFTSTTKTVSSPSGLPSLTFINTFDNPLYNIAMQTEMSGEYQPNMGLVFHSSPEPQNATSVSSEENSIDYQPQYLNEPCTPTTELENTFSSNSSYLLIPDSFST